MKNIMVNIIVKKSANRDAIANIINNCKSSNFNVKINIFDYSLQKQGGLDFEGVDLFEPSFEEISEHEKKVLALENIEEYLAIVDLDSGIMPEEDFLDELSLESFEDENVGSIYSDFYIMNDDERKTYVYQKSFPIVENVLPLVAFSTAWIQKSIEQENCKGIILSQTISKHIPKALCTF